MAKKSYIGEKPEKVLKEVFGYESFRLLQKDVIQNVLAKKDTLAVMPTGGGKSFCYQIPALIFEGLTVVVTPLISLMQDQVASLNASGVDAVFLNSTVAWEDYTDSISKIRRGQIKIVYLSPEGLNTAKIRNLLDDPLVKVDCITIDEAHCVSEWGHDFRPDYLEIAAVRRSHPEAVCLALTATATVQVREDIIKNLALKKPDLLISSFDRPNIFLNVCSKTDADMQVAACIRRHWGESGIIYCFSRRQVDELTEKLQKLGYSALNYHAGLTDQERADHQTSFIRDETQIMVATLAFGMGIDKPNIRFVIHYDLPKSLEQYYQEIGRAGRDGLASEALLLYSAADAHKIRWFFQESADKEKSEFMLQKILDYAGARTCRRKVLLSYFGENYTGKNEKCCDICSLFGDGGVPQIDMTIQCQKLMSCIIRTKSRFGSAYIADVLLGSRAKRILDNGHNMISTWGIGRELTKNQWIEVATLLIDRNFLLKDPEYGSLMLTNDGLNALKNRDKIELPFRLPASYDENGELKAPGTFIPKNRAGAGSTGGVMFPKPEKKSKKSAFVLYKKAGNDKKDMTIGENPEDAELYNAIKKWRKRKASELDVPPYIIFGDKTVEDLILRKPQSEEELSLVFGLGERKIQKFGEEILSIIREG